MCCLPVKNNKKNVSQAKHSLLLKTQGAHTPKEYNRVRELYENLAETIHWQMMNYLKIVLWQLGIPLEKGKIKFLRQPYQKKIPKWMKRIKCEKKFEPFRRRKHRRLSSWPWDRKDIFKHNTHTPNIKERLINWLHWNKKISTTKTCQKQSTKRSHRPG